MPKIVNYSVEMTDKIISDYQDGIEISEIATSIGKSVGGWFKSAFAKT